MENKKQRIKILKIFSYTKIITEVKNNKLYLYKNNCNDHER